MPCNIELVAHRESGMKRGWAARGDQSKKYMNRRAVCDQLFCTETMNMTTKNSIWSKEFCGHMTCEVYYDATQPVLSKI